MRRVNQPAFLLFFAIHSLIADYATTGISIDRNHSGSEIEGGHFQFTLTDDAELRDLELKADNQWYPILGDRSGPRFELLVGGRALTSRTWELLSADTTHDSAKFIFNSAIRKPDEDIIWFDIQLKWEVFSEGAVFATFTIFCRSEAPLSLEKISVFFPVPAGKDFGKFSDLRIAKDAPALQPLRFALGPSKDASYTNEIELLIEDSLGPGGEMITEDVHDGWGRWDIPGSGDPVSSGKLWGFQYSNRIALAFSRPALDSDDSDLIGARVFHWVNFLEPDNWFPSSEELQSMAEKKGTHLVLHHEWMLNRGSNGFPPADYTQVRDPEALQETVEEARSLGMKVLLYIRGVEFYSLDSPILNDPSIHDGIYVDWHGAYGHSFHEARGSAAAFFGDKHYSAGGTYVPARDYFLFGRALRKAAGPDGSLMGHSGSFNTGIFANLNFDGYLAGETASERELFENRDNAVRLGMMTSGVTMAWPEEAGVFHNEEGAAKMAAWGIVPHVLLGLENKRTGTVFPRSPETPLYGPIYDYWSILQTFDFSEVKVLNHPSSLEMAILPVGKSPIEAIGYQQPETGQILVIAANLSEDAAKESFRFAPGFLDRDQWTLTTISVDDQSQPEQTTLNGEFEWTTPQLPAWGVMGFLFEPMKEPATKAD